MKKYQVGVVKEVRLSYYYNVLREDGTWDTLIRNYQGSSGPVVEKYRSDALSKRHQFKPWSSYWESKGYTLIDKLIEDKPDDFPDKDTFPLHVVAAPSISNGDFRARQRAGEICATDLIKHAFEIKYERGNVINDNVGKSLGWKDGDNPLVKNGDIFSQGGSVIKISGVPSVFYEYELTEASQDVHPFDMGWARYGYAIPLFIPNQGIITSALASAESGSFDVLTEIAELPETVDFLSDLLKRGTKKLEEHRKTVEKYQKMLKTATGKFAEKVAKKLASAWLAFRYAIMPIVYSIEDIKKTLKSYKRIFASFRESKTGKLEVDFLGFKQVSFAMLKNMCWIKRSYSPEDLVDQLLGVLKFNPLSTAWELVTLSFVVDWFLNVGDVITAFSGNKAYVGQKATTSRKIEGDSVYVSENASSVKVSIHHACYNRLIIEPRDHIGLQFEFDMNWKRWLDATALSLQPSLKTLKRIKKSI